MTPTDVTTSVMMWWPSASSAGDFSRRPARISTSAQKQLIAAAKPLTASPAQACSSGAGFCQDRQTSAMISRAATTMSTPSRTAEKYSAL